VQLDGRAVKTPAKNMLIVPSPKLAQLIADEWNAQSGVINPETMPMTRRANSALEKVAPQREAVIEEIASYGGSDLLCYRVQTPAELATRQETAWQPWLDWAARDLSAPLHVTTSILHMAQPKDSLAKLRAEVAALNNFALAGLHDLVAITGSLVLGLAMAKGLLQPDTGFALSRIDETWQAEQWGQDEEAASVSSRKAAALSDAFHFLHA
jgi:chaperone required for assembly of F1-ATPase